MTLTTTIPTAPAPLRPFLQYIADRSANDNQRHSPAPRLFATHTARDGTRRRVRCVTASRLGRVGITEHLADDTTPQEYVPAGSLSQFLPTPYPKRPVLLPEPKMLVGTPAARIHAYARGDAARRVALMLARIAEDRTGVVSHLADAAGVSCLDITGPKRTTVLSLASRGATAVLSASNPGMSAHKLGEILGRHYTTTLYQLQMTGLHHDVTDEFDMPFLRALWIRGVARLGGAPGEMPEEVAARLGRLVTITGRDVEPATWSAFRRALALDIAHKRIVAAREQMKCAA